MQFPEGIQTQNLSKITSFTIFVFIFLVFFHIFFSFYFTYLHLSKTYENYFSVSLYVLEIYQRILDFF